MSKTFKSSTSSRQLDVTKFGNGDLLLELYPDDNVKPKISAIAIAASDAPALCLAILEAAGVEACHRDYESYDDGSPAHLQAVMYFLKQYNEAQAERAAAEADRVKLEQEALKLAQAGCEAVGDDSAETLDEMTVKDQKFFLAVARAARELNKEATND